MPRPLSAKARARDIDRAQTCGLLDAGYGEGQLDPTEYQARTAQAMTAKTLGELAALVADLQIPEHLAQAAEEPAPAPRNRLPASAVAAIIVAVVAICGTVMYTSRGDDPAPGAAVAAAQGPATAPGAPGEPQPIVVEAYDPVSAEGIRNFLRRYEEKFGDLQVDDVIFYPTYVSLARAVPDQPHRAQDWSFRGGFSPSRSTESRPLDTVTVDLAALEVDRLAEVLASGPSRVGLLSAKVEHIFVRPDSTDEAGDALVSILFEDQEERTGMIDTRLDGTVVDVTRAEGR